MQRIGYRSVICFTLIMLSGCSSQGINQKPRQHWIYRIFLMEICKPMACCKTEAEQ